MLLTLAVASLSHAQEAPINGMRPSNPARHALVGAKVIVAPGTTLEKATILVRDGVVEEIGADLAVPAGYRVFDLTGKTVFPAFIEPALVVDSADAQSAALRAPGAHWNQNITPEVSAIGIAIPDATLDALRAQGFAVARVLPQAGIFRGSSDMRLLARASEGVAPLELGGMTVHFVGPRGFDFSQFMMQQPATPTPGMPAVQANRGDREGRYPSSLMGSYALMRQTFMDAAWRAKCLAVESSTLPPADMNALDALQPLVRGKQGLIVDASDELEVERLVRLARTEAPNAPLAVLGSGNEFRAQSDLVALLGAKGAGGSATPLILPIDFPQAPDLVSPVAAETVSLRDLMTWRYAPTNPKRFIAAGIPVALSSHRMSDRGSFRKRLADAIAHGLTKDEALAALTTVPAQVMGVDARLGTLQKGKIANLVIASGDPFETETKYDGMFIAGAPVVALPERAVLAAGNFAVATSSATPKPIAKDLRLAIDPKDGTLKATWTPETPAKTEEQAKAGEPKQDDAQPKTEPPAQPEGAARGDMPRGERRGPRGRDRADGAGNGGPAGNAGSATAKRATVGMDGRGSGMFDGAPFGLEGEIRISFAGSGDTATLIAESATGARTVYTLARVKEEPKKEEAKQEEPKKEEAKKEEAQPDDAKKDDAKKDDAKEKPDAKERAERENLWKDALPFPFGEYGLTAKPLSGTVVVKGATIWTLGAQGTLEKGDMLVRDGKIVEIAADIAVPDGATVIDGRGKHVTPGLIDCHSHTGISGGVNEGTQSCTAEVWIGDVIDPTDINWYRQLAGGLTAVNQLHGSANPIGGRNSVVKIRWGEDADGFRLAGAPAGIKFALGENVVRSKSRYPSSRMGVATFLDDSFRAAQEYRAKQKAFAASAAGSLPPRPDLELETLAEILEGTRLVHCHSYRQDEILMLLHTADRFGFRVATLQHVLEGYKVAGEIAARGTGASTFSDWWAYKIEVMDAIPWNGGMLEKAGVVTSFNSDSDELARRMNMEAAKAVRYGGLARDAALKMVTLNPAKQLGIDARTGSLEKGKDADFAVWSGDPLSGFSRCEETWVDGVRRYSRAEETRIHGDIVARRAELIAKATASPGGREDGAAGRGGGGEGGGFRGGRRGRPTTLLGRMLDDREDQIWLRIARGLEPFPSKPGDCGCGASSIVVPVFEQHMLEESARAQEVSR